jgi:hypothetical protein
MKTISRLAFVSVLILCLVGMWWRVSTRNRVKQNQIYTSQSGSNINPSLPEKNIASAESGVAHTNSIADQILALLASNDPRNQSKVYKELLPEWIRRDPQGAADFAQSPEAAKWRVDLMVVVAQSWTDMNVNDAESWALQLSNPTERNMVLGYVTFEEANTDPNRAVQILQDNQLSDDRRTIIVQNLAIQWAAQDVQPLYNWISTQPAGEQRDSLFERVALAQSQSDPVQAAQVVAENIAPGPIQDEAALYVLRQWAQQDMSGAVSWANQFPPDLHDKALQVLSGNLKGAFQPF